MEDPGIDQGDHAARQQRHDLFEAGVPGRREGAARQEDQGRQLDEPLEAEIIWIR